MPTWAWAEQLHARRLDSHITSTAMCRDCVAKHNRSTHKGYTNCSSKTRPRRPKAEKRRFWSTFSREFEKENHQCKNEEKSAAKAPFATFMHPLQYDLRLSAAKNNGIPQAGAAARNFHAAIPLRSAETALQNTIEVRTRATQTAAPKPDLDAQAEKRRFWSTFSRKFGKENHQCQNEEKICCQNTIRNFHAAIKLQFMTFNCKKRNSIPRTQPQQRGTLTQPFHCDLHRLKRTTQ